MNILMKPFLLGIMKMKMRTESKTFYRWTLMLGPKQISKEAVPATLKAVTKHLRPHKGCPEKVTKKTIPNERHSTNKETKRLAHKVTHHMGKTIFMPSPSPKMQH